jgi:hypothetical protein
MEMKRSTRVEQTSPTLLARALVMTGQTAVAVGKKKVQGLARAVLTPAAAFEPKFGVALEDVPAQLPNRQRAGFSPSLPHVE